MPSIYHCFRLTSFYDRAGAAEHRGSILAFYPSAPGLILRIPENVSLEFWDVGGIFYDAGIH